VTPTYIPRAESLGIDWNKAFDDLLRSIAHDRDRANGFVRVRELLEALPQSSAEFGVAVNRLRSAQDYLRCGEAGAARYELNLLRRSLER